MLLKNKTHDSIKVLSESNAYKVRGMHKSYI